MDSSILNNLRIKIDRCLAKHVELEEEYCGHMRADMKVYSALKDGGYLVTDGKVFAPGQNPAVAVNAEFPWRSTLTALGLHQELVCGIGCYKDAQLGMHVAASVVSSGGYENRDLGGVLEAALGQDSLVLSGTGRGDQEFENPGITGMDRNLSMANSMDQGTLLRVMRKAEAGGGYVYCGVYKIVDRWKALVDVGEGGGARRRVRCCFKLARESEQPALKVVQVRQPDEERRSQLEVSQKLLLQDPEEGSHEFCSCCAMDLDGRVGFECDWCQKRLEGGATPPECTPALCQRPGRTGCVHTWPGMLCSECVEAKVLPLVEADGEANRFQWCCALCAARHGMWGGQLPTGRGVWVRDGRALYGAALEAAAGVPQTQEAAGSPGASGSAPALPHTPPIGPAPAGAKRSCSGEAGGAPRSPTRRRTASLAPTAAMQSASDEGEGAGGGVDEAVVSSGIPEARLTSLAPAEAPADSNRAGRAPPPEAAAAKARMPDAGGLSSDQLLDALQTAFEIRSDLEPSVPSATAFEQAFGALDVFRARINYRALRRAIEKADAAAIADIMQQIVAKSS